MNKFNIGDRVWADTEGIDTEFTVTEIKQSIDGMLIWINGINQDLVRTHKKLDYAALNKRDRQYYALDGMSS